MENLPHHDEPRWLMDRPQPLGILPTYWFWRRIENYRLIRWLPVSVYAIVCTINIILPLSLGPVLAGTINGFAMILSVGVAERFIRARAKQRKFFRIEAAGDDDIKARGEGPDRR